MMISKAPVSKIRIIEEPVINGAKNKNSNGSKEKGTPAIHIPHWAHIIKIVVPYQKWNKGKACNFCRMQP
ncbi:hypothetical protein JCM13304A_10410 [Desulfothermus okinawensis JCM 13304]